jgi:hypothetical protein
MQTASLINHLYSQSRNPAPTVGMGATICLWTDRHAATVVAVSENGKTVTVQQDKATRTDNLGMSDCQSYTYEADPKGRRSVFTLRQNGRWVEKGCGMKSGPVLSLGHRDEHYDFSF